MANIYTYNWWGMADWHARQEHIATLKANILETLEFYTAQADHASLQWIHNMDAQFKAGFKCVKDNKRDMNRRTTPKTNELDR